MSRKSTLINALMVIGIFSIPTMHAVADSGAHSANERRVQSDGSKYGWITTVAYGANGEQTTERVAVDMYSYVASGGDRIIPLSVPDGVTLNKPEDLGLLNTCFHMFPDACHNWPPNFDTGIPGFDDETHPGNPGGPAPGEYPPNPPDEPSPASQPCSVGTVSTEQFYANDQWIQTTTYRRSVNHSSDGQCSNGAWSAPIVTQKPAKG